MLRRFAEYYVQLGRNVAYFRRLRGLTQAELAEKLDCETSFIGQIEAPGVVKAMSLDTLFKICEVLSVPPSELFVIHSWTRSEKSL